MPWLGTLAERFARKVDENGPMPEACPELGRCHLWTGARKSNGYGNISVDGRMVTAARVAFFLKRGRWPEPCALAHGAWSSVRAKGDAP
jgi:hypothetical protein